MKKVGDGSNKAASKVSVSSGLFSRTTKYLRFQRYCGISIPEQSARNFQALLDRLRNRAGLPEAEKVSYGDEMLSLDEKAFFHYWLREIVPLFTAKHGTACLSHLQKLGFMMTVADRRRNKDFIVNNQTVGSYRQEFLYFVLGIGDDHPLPSFIEKDVGVVKINFGQISELDKQQFQGMFVSGHVGLTARPILAYGNTLVKITCDPRTQVKETTFIRADGTELKETLHLQSDDIFAAIPDINIIFHALGLRFIEYLRFIGGDFQKDMLKNREIKKTAAAFHSLFPSEHFPELKIPLKKIPLTAPYVEVQPFDVNAFKAGDELHKACKELDVLRCLAALESADVDVLDSDKYTPLQSLLNNYQPYYKRDAFADKYESFFRILTLLLENGSDINKPFHVQGSIFSAMLGNTLMAVVLNKEEPEIVNRLMQGSSHPDCPDIRSFPIVDKIVVDYLLSLFAHGLSNFKRFYPFYRFCYSPNTIIHDLYTYLRCHPKESDAVDSFREIVKECDPNVPCLEYESLTLLMRAAIDGNDEVVDILLQHPDSKINHAIQTGAGKVSEYEGWTALHFAVKHDKKSVIDKLLSAGADQTQAPDCDMTHRDYAAAACVTVVVKGKTYVLLVRKGDSLREPQQHYLFPGGLCDETDENLQFTAARETLEETGVSVKDATVSEILAFSERDKERHIRRGFYYFNLGEREKLPNCIYRDDIASANWIAVDDMQQTLIDGQVIYHVGGLHLRFDNSLMLHAALTHSEIDQKIISENQQLLYRLNEIGEFLVLGLRFIMADDALKVDQQHLLKLIEAMPQGKVKALMEEFVRHVDDVAQKSVARDHLLSIIRYLTQSARCHVDQLIWICPLRGEGRRAINLLHAACQCGDDELIKELLELGANPNNITTNSSKLLITPLSIIIQKEKFELAKLMIDKFNAQVSTRNPHISPLVWCCGNVEVSREFLEYLLNKMPLVNDADIGAAIIALIRTGQLDIIRSLHTRYPVSLNKKYYDPQEIGQHQFPLVCAIQSRSVDMVNLIIEFGADPGMYIGTNTDYRKVVFEAKLQIKKEISLTRENENLQQRLKYEICEMHRIKEVIDELTPDCKWIDPDDVRKYYNNNL